MSEHTEPRSALYDRHVAAGAVMVDVAGWSMPRHYGDPAAEARALRERAGVFDLSHHGRIRIRGDGALNLLERTCGEEIGGQEDDTARIVTVRDGAAGELDTGRLIRLESFWVLVTAPERRPAVLAALEPLAEEMDAKADDQTFKTTMIGVAGPRAADILDAVLPFRASDIAKGEVKFGSLMIARYIAERLDVAGLWGVRVQVPNMVAGQAWRFITEKAGQNALSPVGLEALGALLSEAEG